MMADFALTLQKSGADFVILCTNTMHISTPEIEAALQIPFLHIVDPTAIAICKMGIKTIGLLGTKFTMEEDFYKGRLKDKFGFSRHDPINRRPGKNSSSNFSGIGSWKDSAEFEESLPGYH